MNDDMADRSYDPPERIRQMPSWLAAQVARRAERLVTAAVGAAGLRRSHYAVLTSLAEQGGGSQAVLGRRLEIDRSDMHALLADLEAAGLVARARDPDDGRRNRVELTVAGRRTLRVLDRRVQHAQDELLAPLSAGERDELKRLLALVLARRG
jgi:DNA-binding MarR family transcriptional regulator